MNQHIGFQGGVLNRWPQAVNPPQDIPASQLLSQKIEDLSRQLSTLQLRNKQFSQDILLQSHLYAGTISNNIVPYSVPQHAPNTYTNMTLQTRDPTAQQHNTMSRLEAIEELSRRLQARELRTALTNHCLSPIAPQDTPPQAIANPSSYLDFHNLANANHCDEMRYNPYPMAGGESAYYPLAATPHLPISGTSFAPGQFAGSIPVATPFIPRIPLVPQIQLPARPPEVTAQRFHLYGDCSESLPLTVMSNIWKMTGTSEVRSVAVFVTKLRSALSIPEDGPIRASIRLRDPCLNCKSLMQRLPETVAILGGSGYSHNICWTMGNKPAYVSGVHTTPQVGYPPRGYDNFSLSAAYGANQEQIFAVLEVYALSHRSPFLSANLRDSLVEVWCALVVPYRYAYISLGFIGLLSCVTWPERKLRSVLPWSTETMV